MIYRGAAIANRYVTLQTTDYQLVEGGNLILQPAAGNVGIGTTTAAYPLTLAPAVGTSINQTITLITSTGQTAFGGYVGQRAVSANTRQGLVVSGTGSLTLNARTYNMDFITGAVTPTDDTNLRMRISSTGNVGIGLANPQNMLNVNGTIHSKSVLVDLNGWSDYVFKKDYPLQKASGIGVIRSIALKTVGSPINNDEVKKLSLTINLEISI